MVVLNGLRSRSRYTYGYGSGSSPLLDKPSLETADCFFFFFFLFFQVYYALISLRLEYAAALEPLTEPSLGAVDPRVCENKFTLLDPRIRKYGRKEVAPVEPFV